MSRRLPPMNSLRFFDAAARAGGFLTAARELHVTPGAVSQQVKLLEAYLGTPLFDRRPRGVVLNEAGRAFHAPVAAALDHLALGAEAIGCAQSGRPLRITALPALAERWLVPRLAGFRARHPEIVIRLSADERMVDFAADPYDLGLRYGAGDDAGLDCMALFRDCLTPVCHPTLLGAANRLTDPAALLRWPMLADEQWMGDWPLWLRAAGSPELGAADGA